MNIILIDWAPLSTLLTGSPQAAENAQIVGEETAALINLLIKNRLSQISNFHFVGHSLGGQVGAFISANLTNGILPRLTGLDPALDHFGTEIDASKRLDATDATFVDIISTTSGGPFSVNPIPNLPRGDVDFYPNGGLAPQPGCGVLGVELVPSTHNEMNNDVFQNIVCAKK